VDEAQAEDASQADAKEPASPRPAPFVADKAREDDDGHRHGHEQGDAAYGNGSGIVARLDREDVGGP